MKKYKVALIGAGMRGMRYTDVMSEMPEQFQVISVAEPVDSRREYISKKHHIDPENCYNSWDELLAAPKIADVAIVSTMDRMHLAPAMKAMEQGYNLLLEKPAAPTAEDCFRLAEQAKKCGVKVMVCHVLRYAPFFVKLKNLLNSGIIGKPMSIIHTEAVGNVHQSHSFVRGNWGNAERSSVMLLQKSCHDMDILQWLVEKKCEKIQSFGSLKYFTRDNAPEGAPEYCIDGCPNADTCYYNAVKLYLDDKENAWFRGVAANSVNPTDEEVERALRETQYGKCVFKCDNDVVDHQVVNMEFEDGLTVSFTMAAFNKGGRTIRIMGTDGELFGRVENETAEVYDFKTKTSRTISFSEEEIDESINGGHGGGDSGTINAFYDYLNGDIEAEEVSEMEISYQNHLLAFAAEKSRITGTVVDMDEFRKEVERQ